MSKEQCLSDIKEKFDALYQKVETEEEDFLYHLSESGELIITSLVCFDQSHGGYRVHMTSYNVKDGYRNENIIYDGNDKSVADQVFVSLLKVFDATAFWIDEEGTFSM